MKEIIQNPKLYLVEWQDAHSASGWYSKLEVEKFINKEKCICRNIGWLISEDEKEIALACRDMKWAEEGEDGADTKWGMLQKIPKTWIRKKEILIEDLITKEEAKDA